MAFKILWIISCFITTNCILLVCFTKSFQLNAKLLNKAFSVACRTIFCMNQNTFLRIEMYSYILGCEMKFIRFSCRYCTVVAFERITFNCLFCFRSSYLCWAFKTKNMRLQILSHRGGSIFVCYQLKSALYYLCTWNKERWNMLMNYQIWLLIGYQWALLKTHQSEARIFDVSLAWPIKPVTFFRHMTVTWPTWLQGAILAHLTLVVAKIQLSQVKCTVNR